MKAGKIGPFCEGEGALQRTKGCDAADADGIEPFLKVWRHVGPDGHGAIIGSDEVEVRAQERAVSASEKVDGTISSISKAAASIVPQCRTVCPVCIINDTEIPSWRRAVCNPSR